MVSRCTVEEAVQNNFGGAEGEELAARQSTNAYMLVYIRKSCLKEIVCPVTEDDIPMVRRNIYISLISRIIWTFFIISGTVWAIKRWKTTWNRET